MAAVQLPVAAGSHSHNNMTQLTNREIQSAVSKKPARDKSGARIVITGIMLNKPYDVLTVHGHIRRLPDTVDGRKDVVHQPVSSTKHTLLVSENV